MALEIRYYTGNCITEKFNSFIGCENLSGESKANLICIKSAYFLNILLRGTV